MRIGIIGTGFVGLTFAAALGSKGYQVLAIDSDQEKVKQINTGHATFYEPNLIPLLQKALKKSLVISSDTKKAVNECDLIFITVGTPTTSDGSIDLSSLKSVAEKIGQTLTNSKNKPIIAIKSTVTPGTNNIIKQIIEKKSKKKIRQRLWHNIKSRISKGRKSSR